METQGPPSPDTIYLVNGDFVDRGPQSLEVIAMLLALKLQHPDAVFLNRGNHESAYTTSSDGFGYEIGQRMGNPLYTEFLELFKSLPLACVVEGETKKLLVVHGGIPVPVAGSAPVSLADISNEMSSVEPIKAAENIVTQLLWNDPWNGHGSQVSQRGGWGQRFGQDITLAFLEANGLTSLIRSHEEITGVREDYARCTTGMTSVPAFPGDADVESVFWSSFPRDLHDT